MSSLRDNLGVSGAPSRIMESTIGGTSHWQKIASSCQEVNTTFLPALPPGMELGSAGKKAQIGMYPCASEDPSCSSQGAAVGL